MYNDVDLLLYKNWGQEEFEDTRAFPVFNWN
jgi:hypothetical protein